MFYRDKIIGKVHFSDVDTIYGLELCLHVAGIDAVSVTEKTAGSCDILLASMTWYRDALNLLHFLRASGIFSSEKKPVIVVGGIQATQSPVFFAEFVDYVFLGDGEDDLLSIIDDIIDGKRPRSPHVFAKGDACVPEPKKLPPRPFLLRRKKTDKNKTTTFGNWAKFRNDTDKQKAMYRIEIARGCHYNCAHCELSALKPYAEVPFADVSKLLDQIPGGSHVGIFAPERTNHSEWGAIVEDVDKHGLQDWGADTRLEKIEKVGRYTAFIGLDGVSRRMRKSVGKGYSDTFIMRKLEEFVTTGPRKISGGMLVVYYVCDLPGETAEDWAELVDFYKRLEKKEWSRNLRIRPILNPLSPRPHTKLGGAVIHPLRDYRTMWDNFIKGGDGASRWGMRVFDTRVWGPLERVIDLVVTRGGAAGADVLKKIPNTLYARPDGIKSDLGAVEILRLAKKVGLDEKTLGYER